MRQPFSKTEASSRAQTRIGNSTVLRLFLIAFAAAEDRVDSEFIKTTKMVCCPPRKKQGRTPCQPESFLVIVHFPYRPRINATAGAQFLQIHFR
jgi:hypothetical protein